ncbi:MAG: hypothetical protein ACREVT_04765 [Burkholderiales bacterium]
MSATDNARRIASNAFLVEVFNSGLEVWLHDESHGDALRATGLFDFEVDDKALDSGLKPLVERGLVMAYGLEEDNAVVTAISVRASFGKKELARARWLEPQNAFLSLPSGRLCVESNDALRLGSHKPTDPGVVVVVPAGDYLVMLYRNDGEAMEADGLDEAWAEGPNEIIVLTPVPEAKPVPGQPPILPWNPRTAGMASWSISGRTYVGAAQFETEDMVLILPLDAAGAAQLGLRDGSVIQITVAAAGVETTVVYVTGDDTKFEFHERISKLRPPRKSDSANGGWVPSGRAWETTCRTCCS